MKWFYLLFFTAAVIILGGSVYVIFGGAKAVKTLDQSVINNAIGCPKNVVDDAGAKIITKPGWTKVSDYYKNFGSVVVGEEYHVFVSSKIKTISSKSLVLQTGTKDDLVIDLTQNSNVLAFLDDPGKKITIGDLRPGDLVNVDLNVNLNTGKQTVWSVIRYIK